MGKRQIITFIIGTSIFVFGLFVAQSANAGWQDVSVGWQTSHCYANSQTYTSGTYYCPSGTTKFKVYHRVVTEPNYDYYYIYSGGSQRYGSSGCITGGSCGSGVCSAPSYAWSGEYTYSGGVNFKVTTDGSVVYYGAYVSKISCYVPVTECNSCNVTSMSCPGTVNTGQSFNITFYYYGTGPTNYPYEHRSLWRGTSQIGCKYGNAAECTWHSDSFSTTAPTTPGTYTYYVKCYGASSQSSSYCSNADSSQSCNVNVVSPVVVPTARTDPATSITGTSATLNGAVTDTGGANYRVRFWWRLYNGTWSYSGWTGYYSYTTSFTYNLTSLSKGRTYEFLIEAENSAGSGWGSSRYFITKPDPPSNFTATAVSGSQINLSWSKGSGAGWTMVRRSTSGYPTSPSDGTQAYYGDGTSVSDTSLTAGTTYYYSAWSRADEGGYGTYSDTYVSASATPVGVPTATTNPAENITGTSAKLKGCVTATGGANYRVRFQWGDTASYGTNSGWTDYYSYTTCFEVNAASLTKGKTYHFRIQAENSAGSGYGSDAVFTTKPDAPSGFTSTIISTSQINLSWTKGSGAYYTMVRRSTSGYPTSPTSGTQVYYDTGTSFSDTGLTGGTTYYYSAWSRAYEEGYYQYSDSYAQTSASTPQPCSALNYPTDKWQRVWYTYDGACLGDGPNETAEEFDNNWGTGVINYSRSDQIQFSSSRSIYFATAGSYRFTLIHDDGVKFYIDNSLEIDNPDSTTDKTDVYLNSGYHDFQIDWWEYTGSARISFSYEPSTGCSNYCVSNGYTHGQCYGPLCRSWDQCGDQCVDGVAHDWWDSGGQNGCWWPKKCWCRNIYSNVECNRNYIASGYSYLGDGGCKILFSLFEEGGAGSTKGACGYGEPTAPDKMFAQCALNKCYSGAGYNGEKCTIFRNCNNEWQNSPTNFVEMEGNYYNWDLAAEYVGGKWDASNKQCVECSGNKKTHKYGDTTSLSYVTCYETVLPSGDIPDTCESACGAYSGCDEKNPGDTFLEGGIQYKCSSTCQKELTDTTPPTTNISVKRKSTGETVTGDWLKADTYTIQFTDDDNIGLKTCKYHVYKKDDSGNWTIPIVNFDEPRTCSSFSFDITAGTSPYEKNGRVIWIKSTVIDNADNPAYDDKFLDFDFLPPTTNIR